MPETAEISSRMINLEDETFRLSRYSEDPGLYNSISRWGILERPLILHLESEWIILAGHRRIRAGLDLGLDSISCEIVHEVSPERIKAEALERSFQGRIGPAGKLRLFSRLIRLGEKDLEVLASELCFPRKLLHSDDRIRDMLELPGALFRYADSRELGFRLWEEMVELSDQWKAFLSDSIADYAVSNSQFRNILGLVRDLDRQSVGPPSVPAHDRDAASLLDLLAELRFPELTGMRKRAGRLAENSVGRGGVVSWPHTFEGDRIELKLPLTRREGIQKLDDMIQSINREALRELLEML